MTIARSTTHRLSFYEHLRVPCFSAIDHGSKKWQFDLTVISLKHLTMSEFRGRFIGQFCKFDLKPGELNYYGKLLLVAPEIYFAAL